MHANPTPYATWASVLVRPISVIRNRLEVDVVWASNWLGRPLLPPKVVAKVEDVLGHPEGVVHILEACSYLGRDPKG